MSRRARLDAEVFFASARLSTRYDCSIPGLLLASRSGSFLASAEAGSGASRSEVAQRELSDQEVDGAG